MKIFGKTDVGRVRKTNQDSFDFATLGDDAVFAVVCDGMGGARGGSVASSRAVAVITAEVKEKFPLCGGPEARKKMLLDAVGKANSDVYEYAFANVALKGMGTTVVAVVVDGSEAIIANAGDSRAYHIGPEGISQVTRDHSIVQDMVESGEITPDEAAVHPKKNIITRALGVEKHLDIDFFQTDLKPGDALLLCTDGLSNHVDVAALEKVFRELGEQSAEELIRLANEAGGSDNITVVILCR